MPTTILLIENDAGFAREITEALEGAGYQVRLTGDGKEGLDLAREVAPAAIVLCVELPKMSGYSICQKLKKDEALRAIPLVLTSAEATQETFEQHKKLKARAEDYLLKPYGAQALLDKLAPLAGAPELAEPLDEEVVSLEEELGAGPLGGDPGEELPSLELGDLGDEPAGGVSAQSVEDADLRLLDAAFAGLSTEPAAADEPQPEPLMVHEAPDAGAALDLALEGEQPVTVAELDAAADSLPVADDGPGRAQLGGLGDEADLALDALGQDTSAAEALDALDALGAPAADAAAVRIDEEPLEVEGLAGLGGLAQPPPLDLGPELAAALDLAPEAPSPAVRGASADALRAAGIALLGDPAPPTGGLRMVPAPAEPAGPDLTAELAPDAPSFLAASSASLARLEAELAETRAAVAARDAELNELHDRLDAVTHRAVDAESALSERDAEIASARARAEALAGQVKRGEADLKAGRDDARRAADQVRAAEDKVRAAEAQAAAAAERSRAAEALVATGRAEAAEQVRAAEARAATAVEQGRAAEALVAAAEQRAGAAQAEAEQARAGAAEQVRAADSLATATRAEAERHRLAQVEASRALDAKVAELALALAAAARLEAVEREVEELKTELIVARGEVEGARSEVEKRGAELRRRISDLEAGNAKNEERVVKAYLKIKGDEKVRDKARKALAIALQLLEEGLPPEPAQPRPPAAGAKLE